MTKLALERSEFLLEINPDDMRKRVDITPLFLVTEDLIGYKNPAVNPDLYGAD